MIEEDKKNILFKPYPKLNITEKTRENVLKYPLKHLNCDIRVRMGNFYTNDEYEKRRNNVLNKPLPGEKKLILKKHKNR